jgi:hypothetical protein
MRRKRKKLRGSEGEKVRMPPGFIASRPVAFNLLPFANFY